MALAHPAIQSLVVPVQELSQVGDARRRITSLSHQCDLDESTRGRLALVATEAGTNMVRHARQGQLVIRTLTGEGAKGVEVLAIDHGPGMQNVAQCLRDGYSTAGTSGTGLGALQRLSDVFDIYSQPERGTAVLMQVWAGRRVGRLLPGVELGVICAPHAGESVSGDAWAVRKAGPSRLDVLVADGLGHGAPAAEPAHEAVRLFETSTLRPGDLLPRMHDSLRRTRGAAVAICEIDLQAQTVRFWSIGNVAGVLVRGNKQQQMTGQHGTLGRHTPTLRAMTYPAPRPAMLVMHSDGLTSRWRLAHDLLRRHHPGLLTGLLYRDHRRARDDATVIAVRLPARF